MLEDVIVTGRSGILLTGERALMDVQDDELTRRPHDLSVDPMVAAGDANGLLLLEPADRDALPRVPEAVWLGGVHSVAFGHWIIEFLPKVLAFLGREGFERVALLVDARMPPQHLEAVRLFAGEANPVIVLEGHESIRVERLWVASALAYLPVGPLPAPPGPRTRIGLDDAGFRRLIGQVAPTLERHRHDGRAGAPVPRAQALPAPPPRERRRDRGTALGGRLRGPRLRRAVLLRAAAPRPRRRVDHRAERLGVAHRHLRATRPPHRGAHPIGPSDVGWLAQASRALDIELTALVGETVNEHSRYRWMSDYRIHPALLDAYLETSRPGASDEAATAPRATPATICIWTDEAAPSVPDVRVRR